MPTTSLHFHFFHAYISIEHFPMYVIQSSKTLIPTTETTQGVLIKTILGPLFCPFLKGAFIGKAQGLPFLSRCVYQLSYQRDNNLNPCDLFLQRNEALTCQLS